MKTCDCKTMIENDQMALGAEFLKEERDRADADNLIETDSGPEQIDGDLLSELTLVMGMRIDNLK